MKAAADTTDVMNLRPIGTVRSAIRDRKAMPPMGAPAAIDIRPEFAGGLLHLEKHSHIWVLAWLDRADRDLLRVVPRGVSEEEPDALHGVFAVRSPARPNSIGLTATELLRIDGLRIEVDPLDFLDGTPVLDLKPYFRARDLIFSAASVQIGRPAGREALRESLLRQARNFHGEFCAELAIAVRIVEHFRFEVLRMREPSSLRITVPLGRPCLIDAMMGMNRVSPGRGSLLFHEPDCVRFRHGGSTCEYTPVCPPAGAADSIFRVPDEEIFRFSAAGP